MISAAAIGRSRRPAAATPSTSMAGQVWGAERRNRDTAWPDSSPTRGKAQRSAGTPSRRAAPTEHKSRAAAWLTVHWVECHLLYGKASGRLDGDGVLISSASNGAGKAASGLVRATRLKRAHRSATSARWLARDRPSAA